MDYSTAGIEALEKSLRDLDAGVHFVLRLYVAGSGERSLQAVGRVKHLCEAHLQGRYDLEVIDIYQQPAIAETEQLLAAPTLIKQLPPPLRRVVGNMADEGRVLIALGMKGPA